MKPEKKRRARIALIVVLTLLVSVCAFADGKAGGMRYALVVGAGKYATASALRAPAIDAVKIAAWLKGCGYDEVALLEDSGNGAAIGAGDILDAMRSLAERAERDARATGERPAELTFFFAGHGGQKKGDIWLLSGDVSMERDVIPWIRAVNAELSAILLDACRSDMGETETGALSFPRSRGKGSILVLAGASPGAYSAEAADGSGGYFTKVLLDAFAAGQPAIADLVAYVSRALPAKTLAETGREQKPGVGGDFDPSIRYSPASAKDGRESSATLIVSTVPAKAQVRINGTFVGIAPVVSVERGGLAHVTARLDERFAEKDVVLEEGTTSMVDLELSEKTGKVFFATHERLLRYSADGESFVPLDGAPIVALSPGKHAITLVAEKNLYWEGIARVSEGSTTSVSPTFSPFGELEVRVPAGAILHVYDDAKTRDFLFVEPTVEPVFPVGGWRADVSGESYENETYSFTVNRGERTALDANPPLSAKGLIKRDIDRLSSRYASESKTRATMHAAGLISIGAGIVFAAIGTKFLFDWRDARSAYDAAGLGSDFSRLRQNVVSTRNLMGIFYAGAGVCGGTGITLEFAGPRPEITARKLRDLEASQ
jgi:hypothetical protein